MGSSSVFLAFQSLSDILGSSSLSVYNLGPPPSCTLKYTHTLALYQLLMSLIAYSRGIIVLPGATPWSHPLPRARPRVP